MSVGKIAEALQLPISTVKYKLLAARADIKKEVERLEKDGTKLYALFPFALFPAQFKGIEEIFAQSHSAPAYSAVNVAAAPSASAPSAFTAASTEISSAATAAAAVTGASKVGFFATLAGKIVIAASAVMLVGGGIIAAVVASFATNPPITKSVDSAAEQGTSSASAVSAVSAVSAASADLLNTEQPSKRFYWVYKEPDKLRKVTLDDYMKVGDNLSITLGDDMTEIEKTDYLFNSSIHEKSENEEHLKKNCALI